MRKKLLHLITELRRQKTKCGTIFLCCEILSRNLHFDQFGKIVVQWNWMYNSKNIPSHIVIFDSEETNDVVHFLKNKMKCKRVIDFFHSFAQGDMHASRMRSRIALWRCGVD